jgi:hypothetical protein
VSTRSPGWPSCERPLTRLASSEVRHRDEWCGRQVDVDFRFLETRDVAAALEGAGLPVQARLDRTGYAEVETWRSYLLARRQAS